MDPSHEPGGQAKRSASLLPRAALLHIVEGVATASKCSDDQLAQAQQWFAEHRDEIDSHEVRDSDTSNAIDGMTATSLEQLTWYQRALSLRSQQSQNEYWPIIYLTIAVVYLRESGRRNLKVVAADLELAWKLIYEALTHDSDHPLCQVSRSVNGFQTVPLCNILKDGNIDELFRINLWLPDGKRPAPEWEIHAHQPFAQSWILGGAGTDHTFVGTSVSDSNQATHAEYTLAWKDNNSQDNKYKLHYDSSTITNTHRWVQITEGDSATHRREDCYTIPSNVFHLSEVDPDSTHATLFYFDASRGFFKDAPVLGPKDKESSTFTREPAGKTPAQVAEIVQALRLSERSA